MIHEWWEKSGETGPFEVMMPLDTSFIAEVAGEGACAVTLYLTNSPAVVLVDNFIGNPEMDRRERRAAAVRLSNFIAGYAKKRGYLALMCMTDKHVLEKRYSELGFKPTLKGVTTMVRSL